MKKLMVLIAVTGFALLSFNVTAFAWDPSGTWGIEGRTDAKIEISCKGDACSMNVQSNYGKYKASGFVKGDKLVVAYNYLTETNFGFILFEQQGEKSMLQKTFDLTGKVAWSGRLLRQ
jgi:hypothetical protein